MNTATVAKLEKLQRLFQKHEEVVEQNFTAKQVAIAKYRLGYDEGVKSPSRLHELKETAAHFGCSISYVTKIMRDVSNFLHEWESKTGSVKGKEELESDEVNVRVGLVAAKIVDGKVEVEHEDPEVAEHMRGFLQSIVDNRMSKEPCGSCPACLNDKKLKVGQEAVKLNKQVTTAGIWSFVALVITAFLIIGLLARSAEMTSGQLAVGYGLAMFVAFVGLVQYVRGVSLQSKRNGMIEALRQI